MTLSQFIGTCLSLAITMGSILLTPQPAVSAERIYFKYGPLMFSLPLDALETYVEEGRVTPAFAMFANHMSDATLSQVRQMLQHSYEMDEVAVYRATETPLFEDLLRRLGEMINTPAGINGFYAIRSALVLAAAEPGNWTMMDVMRHFPTDIRINVDQAQPFLNATRSDSTTASSGASNEAFNLLY